MKIITDQMSSPSYTKLTLSNYFDIIYAHYPDYNTLFYELTPFIHKLNKPIKLSPLNKNNDNTTTTIITP